MSLSEDEIDLVRSSFRLLAPVQVATARMFYERLFEIAPEVRPLFPADMEAQGVKLMSMLGAIVAQIHDHAVLFPLVADLARRHVTYGAEIPHYGKVGEALLWTFEQRLGADFTPEMRGAWAKAYTALTALMIAAASGNAPR